MKRILKKILFSILNTPEKVNNTIFSGFSRGIQNVAFEGKNAVPDGCNFSGIIKVGYATTFGYNNFIHGNVIVGKYCQIGVGVAIFTKDHPTSYMSTYINKNLFDGELKQFRKESKVIIGHDVWIGHNVIIVGNVNIGNGAILAAGSVVTKNVEPYAIVGGVPAKELKKRYPESIIKEIEALQWWDKSEQELEKLKPLFFKDFTNKTSIYD
ncbi:CatB-related O-acetyltransferase [uncultured Flavobacterium sp.]|uniref:CatB-related O-acetyltransferase n=1 Tax=uncultured Flavobacterium sp. TaxID=165435 RepID=UPI0030EDD7BA